MAIYANENGTLKDLSSTIKLSDGFKIKNIDKLIFGEEITNLNSANSNYTITGTRKSGGAAITLKTRKYTTPNNMDNYTYFIFVIRNYSGTTGNNYAFDTITFVIAPNIVSAASSDLPGIVTLSNEYTVNDIRGYTKHKYCDSASAYIQYLSLKSEPNTFYLYTIPDSTGSFICFDVYGIVIE